MAAYQKFDSFVEVLAEKGHNLGSDVLKVILTNTAPVAGNTVRANITQIAPGNGYTTDGEVAAQSSSGQVAGTYKLVIADVQWSATGPMGPFRYAVLYNESAAADELIGFWDYGSAITLANGDVFVVDFDATSGVLTLASILAPLFTLASMVASLLRA